ncbi:small GTPase superfamily, Rho type [Kipferlia bialata]|uniref:Small GTPase superfamily, Rho type n=1 Tax=Kipferlia bialata TaxID=797122 RepID=A0A9K3D536_9EUKA|nr:small GTPase superfamily, Rho type [Kipferlia bialata]|eukprot:g11659.t1
MESKIVVKVGLIGDAQVGKTSLMVRYVDRIFDSNYIETLGVNFLEKKRKVKGQDVTLSIWDLGGQIEFNNMMPLVCTDAAAILFIFDLSRKTTLHSIRKWYHQARHYNKHAIPILVGTKYDYFCGFPPEEQESTIVLARKVAKAMRAPLVFCSASHSINVNRIFKLVLSRAFKLKVTVPTNSDPSEPLLELNAEPEKDRDRERRS